MPHSSGICSEKPKDLLVFEAVSSSSSEFNKHIWMLTLAQTLEIQKWKKKNYPSRSPTDTAGGSDSCIQWLKPAFHRAAVRSLITPSILWGSCGDLPPRGCVVRINDINLSQVLGDNAWDMVGPVRSSVSNPRHLAFQTVHTAVPLRHRWVFLMSSSQRHSGFLHPWSGRILCILSFLQSWNAFFTKPDAATISLSPHSFYKHSLFYKLFKIFCLLLTTF